MKLINKFLGLGLLVLFASACGKDNYTEPNREIKVKIVSRTDEATVLTEASKSNSINYRMVQIDDKWELTGTDYGFNNNYGEVNMKYFDGTYLFFPPQSRGSWKEPATGNDTITIEIKGQKNSEWEYPVDPYYLFENVTYSLSGSTLTATGIIKEYNPAVFTLHLVINGTTFIGRNNRAQTASQTGAPGTFTISMPITAVNMEREVLYARVMMQMTSPSRTDWQAGPHERIK